MNRIALLSVAATLLPLCAYAQGQGAQALGPISTPDGRSSALAKHPRAEPAPPSGIPGSRADQSLSAPAEAARVDMPPNEALFDAINRGDMVATKDAIGRGADIHARNVLGLTPLELSVDLGRNDISFLLLSLRGGAGFNASARPQQAAAEAAQPTRAELAAQRRAEQAAQRREAQAARTAAPAPARYARLFGNDGGSPVPQAGFLGFDSAR